MSDEKKQPMVFTFGEQEAVNTSYDLMYGGLWMMGESWYEPPIDLDLLNKLYRATVHHGSALQVKRNVLMQTFKPSKFLSRVDFMRIVQDFLIFGNLYGEKITSRSSKLLKISPAPAKHVRRGIKKDQYWWLNNYLDAKEFTRGSIIHIQQPDTEQEIYGVPDYIGATQSILLNKNATIFRRRYYENGSHAGFILYMTDPAHEAEDIDALRAALKDSKGPGNFRNLFMYAPNGKKDGMQLIPISEVAANDEFATIKNISRDDQLAAHRVPPQLMGIIPDKGGFGDAIKAAQVFAANELIPMQNILLEINDLAGEQVIEFDKYQLEDEKLST